MCVTMSDMFERSKGSFKVNNRNVIIVTGFILINQNRICTDFNIIEDIMGIWIDK
jgi:hypothetical protein